jgi:hypothetical protein
LCPPFDELSIEFAAGAVRAKRLDPSGSPDAPFIVAEGSCLSVVTGASEGGPVRCGSEGYLCRSGLASRIGLLVLRRRQASIIVWRKGGLGLGRARQMNSVQALLTARTRAMP